VTLEESPQVKSPVAAKSFIVNKERSNGDDDGDKDEVEKDTEIETEDTAVGAQSKANEEDGKVEEGEVTKEDVSGDVEDAEDDDLEEVVEDVEEEEKELDGGGQKDTLSVAPTESEGVYTRFSVTSAILFNQHLNIILLSFFYLMVLFRLL